MTGNEDDHTGVAAVVAALAAAQRDERVDDFVGLFRADAVWTTGHGHVLIGRDEIAAFTRRVLPGAMRGVTASYDVMHVVFVRPDVAAVKVRQVVDGREGSPLFVMAREGGGWRLVACQNTEVVTT